MKENDALLKKITVTLHINGGESQQEYEEDYPEDDYVKQGLARDAPFRATWLSNLGVHFNRGDRGRTRIK